MQGLPQDNNELESSFNMGFSSILTVLQSIENGQNSIIGLFNKAIDMFDNIADNIGTTFNTSIGKLGIGGLTNYSKLNYNVSIKSLKILDSINNALNKFSKNVKTIDNSENMNFGKQEVKGEGNTIFNAKEIFNLNIIDGDPKKIEMSTNLLKEINKFFSFKKEYKLVEEFFVSIRKEFYLINNVIFKVGQGFAFLTASLIALTVVNYASIVKLATILPAVGLGLFIFIVLIKKAFSSKRGGGFMNGLKEMFSTWSLMKMLPDLLTSLGKGALFLSLSLVLFNAIGYDAILKMGVALLALGFSVKMMVDTQGLGLGMTVNLFLIATLITITTAALFTTSRVKWDSVFKLPTFIMLLGFALRAAQFDKIGKIKLMSILSASLLLIVISLTKFHDVTWENTIKLNLFILGLGLSLRAIRKDMSVMSVIAIGMMMLTASLLDFQELNYLSILQIVGVIGLLGFIINKVVLGSTGISSRVSSWTDIGGGGGGGMGFGLMGFAFGLAFLAGAMYLMTGISWKTVGQVIVFIAALGLVFKIFFSERRGGMLGRGGRVTNVPSMIGFGLGMGLLVLALDAVSDIEWKSVFQLIVFIIGIGLAIRLMGRNSKTSGMLGYALGIGILILALDAMTEISWESVFKLVLFTAGIAGAMRLMGPVGAWKMIAFSLSIAALGWVLYKIGTQFNQEVWKNVVFFTLSIAALTGVVWLLGKVAGQVAKGILAAIGIALVTYIMSKALQEVAKIKFSMEGMLTFLGGTIVIGLVMTLIGALLSGPQFAVFAVGAGAVLIIAGVTYLLALALQQISVIEYDVEKFKQFAIGVGLITDAYINLDPIATIAAGVVSLALLPILLVSLGAIGILRLISYVNFDDKKIETFGKSLSLLINTFNDNLGLIAAGKASLKSVAILPVLGVMFMAALLMNRINKLELSENAMNRFNSMFKLFINNTIDTIKEKAKEIKDISPALKSIAQLMNMGTTLARTVGDIANLKFYEFTVKDGKLVLSNVRTLTPKDFTNVGVSIGKLINALISPLKVLGSNSDTFMVGSESIPNPFKNNNMKKGVEMVKQIAEIFKPLVDTIKLYAGLKISYDKKAAYDYTHSLKVVIGTYLGIFSSLDKYDYENTENSISFIADFNKAMEEVDISKFKAFDGKWGDFISKMTDSSKWKKIHYNTATLARNLHSTAKAINSIDLAKAAALENNVKQMVEENNSDKIKQVIEAFGSLFMSMQNQQNTMMGSFQNNYSNTPATVGTDGTIIPLSGSGFNNYQNTPGIQEINQSKTINNNQENNSENQQPQMSGSDMTNYKLDKLTSAINNLVLKLK